MNEKRIELIKVTKDNMNQLQVVIVSTLPVRYPSSFYKSILKGSNVAYLAVLDGKTVGCVVWREEEGGSHLLSLGVYVLHRRRGVGTALINLFIKLCNAKDAYLYVSEDNIQAILFYQAFAFITRERVEEYYRGLVNTTAIKMVKNID